MSRRGVYKDMLELTKRIKNCVAIFETHLEIGIEELEGGTLYSPEAGNDPYNEILPHKRPKTISDKLYQDCSTYFHNRQGTVDGELMRILLDVYTENIKKSDKKDFDDVMYYAKEKGLSIVKGVDNGGENVLILYQNKHLE